MKNSLKSLIGLGLATSLFLTVEAKAQDSRDTRLGIGLNLGTGTKKPLDGFAVGGDVRLQKDFAGPLSGTLTTGYQSFDGKDVDAVGFIPVKAGLKGFIGENFYLGGEVGAGFGVTEGTKTSFVWSPTIGYAFNNGLDIGVKYEDYAKKNYPKQVALRVGYGFNLSK